MEEGQVRSNPTPLKENLELKGEGITPPRPTALWYGPAIQAIGICFARKQNKKDHRVPQPTYIFLMTILWDESILSPEGYPPPLSVDWVRGDP